VKNLKLLSNIKMTDKDYSEEYQKWVGDMEKQEATGTAVETKKVKRFAAPNRKSRRAWQKEQEKARREQKRHEASLPISHIQAIQENNEYLIHGHQMENVRKKLSQQLKASAEKGKAK